MAAYVRSRLSVTARLRGTGTGAFLGTARALSTNVRGRQHASRQLHNARELLPYPPPAVETRDPQAVDPDDAEIVASSQAHGFSSRRINEPHFVSSIALGCRAIIAE